MALESLVGSRIRERRMLASIKQSDLAQKVGISASYLNLIEHDKRKIGGKLLLDIASILHVEPYQLSQGAEASLIEALKTAVQDSVSRSPDIGQLDEFAGRFPEWAMLIKDLHQRVRELETQVETLTDRLSHDPQLAASMHDLLSMVTAVRSTASILHDNKELEPEWRARFHRNLNEDSRRLAEGSQALVRFLDDAKQAEARISLPQDELDAFLKKHDYHFESLEDGGRVSDVLDGASELISETAQKMAQTVLAQYASDCDAMPMNRFMAAIDEFGLDFSLLSRRFKVTFGAVLRRVAVLHKSEDQQDLGLVACNNAGMITFRKEVPGFVLPRFVSPNPEWPLFRALSRPMQPVRDSVDFSGRYTERFDCIAVAEPSSTQSLDGRTLFQSFMLIVPERTVLGHE